MDLPKERNKKENLDIIRELLPKIRVVGREGQHELQMKYGKDIVSCLISDRIFNKAEVEYRQTCVDVLMHKMADVLDGKRPTPPA